MEQYGLNPEMFGHAKRPDATPNQNCWEFFNCKDIPTCPVPKETRLNGIHSGKNAGRACWVVAGTLCGGNKQGSHIDKEHGCLQCKFYNTVKEEEFEKPEGFRLSMSLVQILKSNK
ncbi:MAG: hypothetical protein M0Z79_07440 [Nitrospiraceae bacterium]|nr:hypothetical protein [Nitrospiraceae bacterium]